METQRLMNSISGRSSGGAVANAVPDRPGLAWWCNSTDLRIASVRMRAALLMRMLSQRGIETTWFSGKEISRYRCVVVRKRYDDDTVKQLSRFKGSGGRLVLDLCDNNFLSKSQNQHELRKVKNLRLLATLADVIVAASESLAQIAARECPATAGRIVVIGDIPDDLSIVENSLWRRTWNNWCAYRELNHLERVAPAGVVRLVWFGASAAKKQLSGMADLARICPMLADLGQEYPLHLTVVSNNINFYRKYIKPALPSSRYIEWNSATFDYLLRQQHIALIPAQHNEYTVCKSDNRVVTALRAGLAVVADPVPSYVPYGEVIQIGSMKAGLRHYLADPSKRIADAAQGQARVLHSGQAQRIVAQWIEVCGF